MSDSVILCTVALQALCPWDSPDKNTGVGFHAFLQGIVLTQGSNPCLLCHLHWQAGSLPIMPPTGKTLLQSMGSQRDRNHSVTFTYSHWKTKQSDKKKKRATTKNTIQLHQVDYSELICKIDKILIRLQK